MIVKKMWITNKFSPGYKQSVESHWEGYFLFGIIPLYIKMSKNIQYPVFVKVGKKRINLNSITFYEEIRLVNINKEDRPVEDAVRVNFGSNWTDLFGQDAEDFLLTFEKKWCIIVSKGE